MSFQSTWGSTKRSSLWPAASPSSSWGSQWSQRYEENTHAPFLWGIISAAFRGHEKRNLLTFWCETWQNGGKSNAGAYLCLCWTERDVHAAAGGHVCSLLLAGHYSHFWAGGNFIPLRWVRLTVWKTFPNCIFWINKHIHIPTTRWRFVWLNSFTN